MKILCKYCTKLKSENGKYYCEKNGLNKSEETINSYHECVNWDWRKP